MGPSHQRLHELASLIRIKKIELEMLQIRLRGAHASKRDATDIRRTIADFAGELSVWESEWESLFREKGETRSAGAG